MSRISFIKVLLFILYRESGNLLSFFKVHFFDCVRSLITEELCRMAHLST